VIFLICSKAPFWHQKKPSRAGGTQTHDLTDYGMTPLGI